MEGAAEARPVVLLQCCTLDLATQRHGDAAPDCVREFETASLRDE